MQNILTQIQEFADRAHGDQKRKYTRERYIFHPMRVMETCRKYTEDLSILGAALLHDVVEDTPITQFEIAGFLSSLLQRHDVQSTVRIVVELTDVFTNDRFPGMKRSARKANEAKRLSGISPEAQTVKYADIIDNTVDITKHDRDFAPTYLSECSNILKGINKGNKELYKLAIATIDDCYRQIKFKGLRL